LASARGEWNWDDPVASFDHNALKNPDAMVDGEFTPKAFSLDMSRREGNIRFAFYFHNPNPANLSELEDNGEFPLYLQIHGIAFAYDNLCAPAADLKAEAKDVEATLTWSGEGEEYGITYYPADDKTQAKTVYQDATAETVQTVTLTGLTARTDYKAEVVSYCTKGNRTDASDAVSVEFRTQATIVTYTLTVTVTPEDGGTVKGTGAYFAGDNVTLTATPNGKYAFIAWLDGNDTLSKETTYKFQMPAEDIAYTAVFAPQTSLEDLVKASFSVSTDNGRLIVRNLNGLTVKDIDIYDLTGRRINRFTPNSREDLMLPVDAERALLFVRLNTEKGVAIYKVYLH
ncbi:MAG: hypothetical protein K2L03_00170, partial [Bacteroidales bacterium]|nr:hypothetical protein [Bacteroidales bacterium]